ncbi:hypothetical protein P691DRAFT_594439 [Macrolepiota fuliginosa MF-IS2]|uniref:Histone H1 n=1 Tax=Macrolepiota fuliginosa MF-IS2 TaxID=1400762 RepID=A0A9P6C2H6_9AGAR|nr:hypothetical protein P691DRAFT_594439 [Macrolepiota fuliginosa MF-IS2]
MASLNRPGEESSNPEPTSPNTEVPATAEPQPPDKQPENSPATATAQTPAPPTPVLPATPAPPPVQQQLQYPHQPYGYSQHPPAAYPHAPYYPPPPGYPAYPPSYPHYPPPVPNGYPHPPPPPPPHPAYPPPPNPMYPSPHVSQPPAHQDQGSDDLPSYEEMLVEALQESTDPEGCAPKDLFTWMAARYPLQSNFRPSASQALQKAFKRGRLEKSSNGKYRLSASWEGGNVRVYVLFFLMFLLILDSLIVDIETDDKTSANAITITVECRSAHVCVSVHTCSSCSSSPPSHPCSTKCTPAIPWSDISLSLRWPCPARISRISSTPDPTSTPRTNAPPTSTNTTSFFGGYQNSHHN